MSASLALLIRTAGLDHATKLELASKLATEVGQVLHELLDDLYQGLLGGDLAVRLDSNEHLGDVWMRDCDKVLVCVTLVKGQCALLL